MALIDLPPEIINQIAKDLPVATDRLMLARTCKHVCGASIEALYSELKLSGTSYTTDHNLPSTFNRCMKSLAGNPSAGSLVRYLSIDLGSYPCRYYVEDPHKHTDSAIRSAIERMPNLKYLNLDHAMGPYTLSGGPSKLEYLWLADVHEDDGGLYIDMLQSMMALPKLRDISIMARRINEDSLLALVRDVGPRKPFSVVSQLCIWAGNISHKVIDYLLMAPIALTEFRFGPYTDEKDVRRRWGAQPGLVDILPRLSHIFSKLARHGPTLEHLEIERGHGFWHQKLIVNDPLKYMTNLKSLSISLDILLGWRHCEHNAGTPDGRHTPPEQLASLLPSTIENLNLDLEEFHWHRNGPRYLYTALKSILDDKARLSNLKIIKIKHFPDANNFYCEECQNSAADNIELNQERLGISYQEHDAIIEMMSGAIETSIYTSDSDYTEWDGPYFDQYHIEGWLEGMTGALEALFHEQE